MKFRFQGCPTLGPVRPAARSVAPAARLALLALVGVVLGVGFAATTAAADSCRGWQAEQRAASEKIVGLYLSGASEEALDHAMFELLQREAYLTACPIPVDFGREQLVGWRLVGRPRSEFAAAVVDSLLERAGYDVELAELLSATQLPALAAQDLAHVETSRSARRRRR